MNGDWLLLGRDGRLSVYLPSNDAALWRAERVPAGAWEAPRRIGGDREVRPECLAAGRGPDGYTHLVAWRRTGAGRCGLVHTTHFRPLLAPLDWQSAGHPNKQGDRTGTPAVAVDAQGTSRPVTEWRSLGNPHPQKDRAARLGAPLAAVSTTGRVHVLVPNAGGGLMLRREGPSGKWDAWLDLKGSGVRDGFAAAVHPSGRIEVFAGNSEHVMRWSQAETDGDFGREPNIPLRVAPGTASVLETAPGRSTYYWADEDTGQMVAHRPGGWVIPLGGASTGERIAVLRTVLDGYDCTVLAHRGLDGEIMVAACGTENEGAGLWWSPAGGPSAGAPALALDAHGRVVLALISPDGRLRVARQGMGPGLDFDPPVGV
ncbi:putative protein OS=Streptomyces tendae OX=1932 GN=GUR47_31885 PE=4 SV=1 [Streptomyces tendae]